MSFKGRMSYSDYLMLEKVLDAQEPLSKAHDEMLFIIQHQTSEFDEARAARDQRRRPFDPRRPAGTRIQDADARRPHLRAAEQCLGRAAHDDPSEYTTFRESLGQSSGFQSWQYRAIEFLAGNRNVAMLGPHAHRPDIMEKLEAILAAPSLYDEAIRLLSRNGFDVGEEADKTDWRETRAESDKVFAAWQTVYRDPERYWMLYELAEKLVDFEDYFRRWRFNHVTTVERIIGMKRGTGGTSGASYLKKMLEVELFPELWHVRTGL